MGITVKDIAALANCSTTTVSKVLNNRDMNISEETKARILSIAAEHNYVPNFMAKSLRGQKTNTLGFVLPDITNPFYSNIARGIEDAARERNFSVVFSDIDNDLQRVRAAFDYLASRMVDGIIFDQIGLPMDLSFLPRSIPTVIVDRLVSEESPSVATVGKVFSDTQTAIREITKLHIQAGSKNLAFVAQEPLSISDRYYGFTAALEESNLPLQKDLIYWGRYDFLTGSTAVEHFFKLGVEFDSVICGNDLIAVGVMDALKAHGIRIPEDVRVSGVGDIDFVRYLTPSLTTVAQFSHQMGEAAANMLVDHIVDRTPLYQKEIAYQIVIREST